MQLERTSTASAAAEIDHRAIDFMRRILAEKPAHLYPHAISGVGCCSGEVLLNETLAMLQRMQADGILESFAIAGAVGATFYLEPSATEDIDVFVMLPATSQSSLLSLSPIYEYLISRGCHVEGAHIVIGGWPVQFLPVSDELQKEALEQAVEADVEGTRTRVLTAEHLVAIALQTGRTKDYARILHFLESGAVERAKLEAILTRHGLREKWQRFVRKYLEEHD
jgi:hypothetical protein